MAIPTCDAGDELIGKRARVTSHLNVLYYIQYHGTGCDIDKMYEKLDLEIQKFHSRFFKISSFYHKLTAIDRLVYLIGKIDTFESGDKHIFARISRGTDELLYQVADVTNSSDDNIFRICVFNSLDVSTMDSDSLKIYNMIKERYELVESQIETISISVRYLYKRKYGRDLDEGVTYFTDVDIDALKDDFKGP